MRYLITIFLFLLFCVVSFHRADAANYMSKGDIILKNSNQHGVQIYKSVGQCEIEEGEKCFNIDGKHVKYYSVQTVQVDDLSSPIWEPKSAVEVCSGFADCNAKLTLKDCSVISVEHQAFIDAGYTEVYCTMVTGYNQKDEEQLLIDNTLKTAHDTAEAAKVQEKDDRKTRLEGCVVIMEGNPSNNDIKDCLKDILLQLGY